MKARRVKKLDPEGSFADNAQRIVRTRLDELCELCDAALNPRRVRELHDARIAAKRLRYVLEFSKNCFGPYAHRAARHARRIQDEIGAVHDCDVMIPLVRRHLEQLRSEDAAALRAAGGDGVAAARRAPNAGAYEALELLLVTLLARRDESFERFAAHWRNLDRAGFAKRLSAATAQRSDPAPVRQGERSAV